jgi:hypothetical protein
LENGEVEVTLRVESGELCALAAILKYNSEDFYFVNATVGGELAAGEESFVLSYDGDGGEVRFVADGVKNAGNGEILAQFYFRPRRDGAFALEFFIRGVEGICAAVINCGGSICEASVDFARAMGRIYTRSDEKPTGEIIAPKLVRANAQHIENGEGAQLELAVTVDADCFAVGVKLFVVDVKTGQWEIYYFARHLRRSDVDDDRAQSFNLSLPMSSRACIIVTPVAYFKKESAQGDKAVLVIMDIN